MLHMLFRFSTVDTRTTEIENDFKDASQTSDQSFTIRQSRTMFAVSNRARATAESSRSEEDQTGSSRRS